MEISRDLLSPNRIAVQQNGRVFFVRLDDLDWIEAADNYVLLHCGPHTYTVRATLSELERMLDSQRFIRIHRSSIVNFDRIAELQTWFRGDYRVILRDGTELILKKRYRDGLERAAYWLRGEPSHKADAA